MGVQDVSYKREPAKFVCHGINLSVPVDLLPPGMYRALENVRPYGEGQIIGRPGLDPISTGGPIFPIHTIRRMNDPVPDPNNFPGAFNKRVWLVGNGTTLNANAIPGIGTQVESGLSGDPLSIVIDKPDFSNRPWAYIADSLKMRKMSSNPQVHQWGVSPPEDAPTIALAGANPNGPDVGTTGAPYVYRYRGRESTEVRTGAYGNAGPPVRDAAGLSPTPGQNIRVTIAVAHPDPFVNTLDIFRYGGSLTEWIYVGSVGNFVGSFMDDTLNDAAIADNPRLEFDNFQPFTSFDQPRSGTATITPKAGGGADVNVTAGAALLFYDPADLDKPYYGFGNQILIAGQAYTFYKSPDSATHVEVVETPAAAGGGNFTLPSPQIWHKQIQFVWGPFGGGSTGTFLFAVGDINRPGALYWTKGNRPESAPDANVLDITSPSEPLQNGCMWDGRSWLFSSERLFAIYPTFGEASDFIAIEVPNSKGLFMRWCLCVGKNAIYFRARDGIYKCSGATPQSITDKDLFSIFPHESPTSSFIVDGQAATPNGAGGDFVPPDDTVEAAQRLAYADGFVYFDYRGTDGNLYTLVYNETTDAWVSRDDYHPQIKMHYADEGGLDLVTGDPIHEVLLGGLDGNIYRYFAGASDAGSNINGRVRTRATDTGDPRPRKLFGDILFDYETQCQTFDVVAGFDNFTFFSVLTLAGTNFTGRRRSVLDINGGLGQYAANLGLDVSWSTAGGRPALYFWEPSYLQKPELTVLRATDWTDDGYPGAKFFQGFYIEGDSLGVPRSFDVQSDGGGVQQTFTFNAGNQQETPFSFTLPFISRLVRITPKDANFWRVFKIRWIWEPAPDLALNWITQGTTHDYQNFFHHRDARIAIIAGADVLLVVTRLDDGTTFSYTIPNTGGIHQKQYIVLQPMKAKIVSYSLTSPTAFRLFVKDTSVRVGEWGRGEPYRVVQPFGDVSRDKGAII